MADGSKYYNTHEPVATAAKEKKPVRGVNQRDTNFKTVWLILWIQLRKENTFLDVVCVIGFLNSVTFNKQLAEHVIITYYNNTRWEDVSCWNAPWES